MADQSIVTIKSEDELKERILPLLRQAYAELTFAQIAGAMGEALATFLLEEDL